ncbi:nucleolar protein 14 homolog [Sitodiplosis mosellana]|uniref:nucleolar protein 14 homolog n=1 Tax=Sitodiplosis mosellana TaxID=263140 RepID=UPI002444024C|nr:nucleolar protein 14 homolog [Sitodiplosis mosellana]
MGKFKSKKGGKAEAFTSKKKVEDVKKSLNPFELHTNREKISVLGRKLKHDKGMPGISRAKATQRRKDTLGREFLQKNKTNKFKDNRIGRRGMSEEDAANARFIAERLEQFKTKKKQSKFNLNENEEVLTHKGQTLEEVEQFHDTISDDDDDDEIGKLDAEFTGAAHFGGKGVGDTDGKRKNAIEDLIADQKRRKAEISIEKEVVSNLTHKLDANWKDLVPLMSLQKDQNADAPKPDDFDKVLKEMVFDRRGTVTDKLDTDEKVLKKEKAKLERLEKERIDRMHGLTEEEKQAKHRSADDLDDGYFLESTFQEQKTLAYNQDGKANRDDDDTDEELDRLIALSKNAQNGNVENGDEEDGNSEEGSEEDSDVEGEEEESSGEGDAFSDLVYESDSEPELNKSKDASLKKSVTKKAAPSDTKKSAKVKVLTDDERKAMMEKAKKELPYTFELPQKYNDLDKQLKKYSADYQAVILERMIKCNHPKLEPANRERMVSLFAFLLQYINDLASDSDPVHCFTVLDRILPFLYDISHIVPAETTKCFLEVIKEKQSEFRNSKEFPKLDTLVFLKIVSSLYSVSDFRHGIASPCVIFISQILTRSRVSNRSDISSGLFLVTVLLEYTQLSKRYLPAALNFLAGVLYLGIRKRSVHQMKVVPPFKSVGELSSLLVLKKQTAFDEESRLMAIDLTKVEIDNSFKVRAFNTAVLLTKQILSNLDNCGLQFLAEPFSKYLDKIDLKHYPEKCKENVSALLKVIDRINSEPLTYLVPELKRPKTLRQLEPKYERVYDDRRDRSKNAGNAAVRKGLQRKIKKETKGAVREIRRDNAFLAKVQLKRRLQSDVERRDKVKRIFSEASIQQGELNAIDRKKKHL